MIIYKVCVDYENFIELKNKKKLKEKYLNEKINLN